MKFWKRLGVFVVRWENGTTLFTQSRELVIKCAGIDPDEYQATADGTVRELLPRVLATAQTAKVLQPHLPCLVSPPHRPESASDAQEGTRHYAPVADGEVAGASE